MASNKRGHPARRVARLGMLLALALALSFVEASMPALPFFPLGVKLGLSNVITMYSLLFSGGRDAFSIAILKSCFVLLLRGPIGALLSLAGGVLSLCVMMLLRHTVPSLSDRFVSMAGAIGHNVGQLLLAVPLLGSLYVLYYLPVMLLAGVAMGLATGLLLKLVMPYLQRMDRALK
ncbi:MAG: Gx transporter family protein [Oscillospiraceae bacterium]